MFITERLCLLLKRAARHPEEEFSEWHAEISSQVQIGVRGVRKSEVTPLTAPLSSFMLLSIFLFFYSSRLLLLLSSLLLW